MCRCLFLGGNGWWTGVFQRRAGGVASACRRATSPAGSFGARRLTPHEANLPVWLSAKSFRTSCKVDRAVSPSCRLYEPGARRDISAWQSRWNRSGAQMAPRQTSRSTLQSTPETFWELALFDLRPVRQAFQGPEVDRFGGCLELCRFDIFAADFHHEAASGHHFGRARFVGGAVLFDSLAALIFRGALVASIALAVDFGGRPANARHACSRTHGPEIGDFDFEARTFALAVLSGGFGNIDAEGAGFASVRISAAQAGGLRGQKCPQLAEINRRFAAHRGQRVVRSSLQRVHELGGGRHHVAAHAGSGGVIVVGSLEGLKHAGEGCHRVRARGLGRILAEGHGR